MPGCSCGRITISSEAADFFISIVKPTVNEFLTKAQDIRCRRLAAIVFNHTVDYLALDKKQPVERLREKLIIDYPDFSLIRDVADATKHAKLSRKVRGIDSEKQIQSTKGIFQAPFGEDVFAEAVEIFVTLNNGDVKCLEPAIMSV